MKEDLSFYYSAMKGGKTTRIFQKIHDLEENGQTVLLIKPKIDTKGNDCIINRKGEQRKIDILLDANDKLLTTKNIESILFCNHIIVDEVQFLTKEQIEELWMINKKADIKVSCYGLKTNFKGELFEGSARLMALADNIVDCCIIFTFNHVPDACVLIVNQQHWMLYIIKKDLTFSCVFQNL